MASTDLIRAPIDAASDQRYPGTSAQPARCALVRNERVPSRDLDNAVCNPVLRDAVGLGGAETEVGTGVEGGRW
jgi:hypothetical protein